MKHRINNEISSAKVRLVTEAGSEVVSLSEAVTRAGKEGKDLVEVSPNPTLPVCKILDYGKFLYEKQKSEHKQKVFEMKEIKIRPSTDEHDYQVKVKKVKEFLGAGHKVKISLRFKGREMAHQDLGHAMLERIRDDVMGIGHPEGNAKLERRDLYMILTPERKTQTSFNERK